MPDRVSRETPGSAAGEPRSLSPRRRFPERQLREPQPQPQPLGRRPPNDPRSLPRPEWTAPPLRHAAPAPKPSERSIPPPPPAARAAFGDSLPRAVEYTALLATEGVRRGLIGPHEVARIWERHLLNCAAVAPLIPSGAAVCDVGSGAGLPGLVVALVRPDLRMVLLDSVQRRTTFLSECVTRLQLSHVTVVRGRAEEQAGRLVVDVVLARAVAPLDRLARWCLPLLQPGGLLIALKGESAAAELAASAALLRRLGATAWEVRRVGAELVDPPTTVICIAVGERRPASVSARRRRGRSAAARNRARRREG
jgi:16S rRNA (guanine527-N7)-methyltransferase